MIVIRTILLLLFSQLASAQITDSVLTSPFSFINDDLFILGNIKSIHFKGTYCEPCFTSVNKKNKLITRKCRGDLSVHFSQLTTSHAIPFYNDVTDTIRIDSTKFQINSLGQLIRLEDATFEYDIEGRLVKVRRPEKRGFVQEGLTEYIYDNKNRVLKRLNKSEVFESYEEFNYVSDRIVLSQIKALKDGRNMSESKKYLISKNRKKVTIYKYEYGIKVSKEIYKVL